MLIPTGENEFVNTDHIVSAEKEDSSDLLSGTDMFVRLHMVVGDPREFYKGRAKLVWDQLQRISDLQLHPPVSVCCLDKPFTYSGAGGISGGFGAMTTPGGGGAGVVSSVFPKQQ